MSQKISLNDKWELDAGRVYLTGSQALARLPKFLTKAITEGQQTGPVKWCEFDVGDKKSAEAFLAFCRRKMEWLRAETPTLVVRRTSSAK